MPVTIRDATAGDDAVIDAIAREGDASAGTGYLELVRADGGRLLVAERGGRVVAYGGVVPVGPALMLCDLFVTTRQRGNGIAGLLLGELFGDVTQRMTFSSRHPAAVPAYRRAGMEPSWHLLYLQGRAPGGGSVQPAAPWAHDRERLVHALARQGAHVTADVITVAHTFDDGEVGRWIIRLQSADPVSAFTATVASFAAGTKVLLCAPEHSPVAAAALAAGFEQFDHDIFCATPGTVVPADLHALDPGLV